LFWYNAVTADETRKARELLKALGADPPYKPVYWCGSSYDDLMDMPDPVRRAFGVGIRAAQGGRHHPSAKPLTTKKHKGWSVVELVEPYDTDVYRAVYTVSFPNLVCVLHVFKKKSHEGSETPKRDKALIETKFTEARDESKNPSDELQGKIDEYKAAVAAAKDAGNAGTKASNRPPQGKRR